MGISKRLEATPPLPLCSSIRSKLKRVFVTVGSTSFDALIHALAGTDDNTRRLRQALHARGYSSIVFQIGRGSVIPVGVGEEASSVEDLCSPSRDDHVNDDEDDGAVSIHWFRYAPSIQTFLQQASLIISHAGAGSILESLRLPQHTPLLVVVNHSLMDNHQAELAVAMASRRFCKWTTPGDVLQQLEETRKLSFDDLEQYPKANEELFPQMLMDEMRLPRRTMHGGILDFLTVRSYLLAFAVACIAIGYFITT